MKMIKKYLINKIVVSSLCLVLLLLFYFVPTNKEYKTEIKIENRNKEVVYLLDKDNYVSRVNVYFDSNTIEDKIRNIIENLTNNDDGEKTFNTLIPKGTKVNSIKVDKNTCYIDFSEDILKVNKYIEESMIEAIVYSITEINGIDNIYISVNGKTLEKLPNSNKQIEMPLNRSYGINKEYDITSFNDIDKTTIFFSKEDYFVPITKISNRVEDKIDIIVNELKSSINAQNNLYSYMNDNVKLLDYNIEDNKMTLVFNEYLFNDSYTLENVNYLLSKSIFENYDVEEVVITNVNKSLIFNIKNNT